MIRKQTTLLLFNNPNKYLLSIDICLKSHI